MTNLAENDNSSNTTYTFSQNEKVERKIPLFGENFDVTKKIEETQLNLSKKWVTTTKKIEIPVRYEDILINDKDLDSFTEGEITEIFSKIKHKISDVFSHQDKKKDNENKNKEDHQHQRSHHYHNEIEVKNYVILSNVEKNVND